MGGPTARVAELSLEEKVGQLLHVGLGPDHLQTDVGWPDRAMRRVIEELQPGAVRVYGTSPSSPHFVAQSVNRLQQWAENTTHGLGLLISADCEYGTADVVRSGTQAYPSLMGRTATGDPALARDVARAVARDMLSMGISMTHQPVVDVNTNPRNPIIGVRSPGSDPETVSRFGTALLEGVHDESQIAVAKHFPGHGNTESDSHHGLPRVTYDRQTLTESHLRPFERLIAEGVDCIMTAHIVVDCLDPNEPATLSPAVLTDLLRTELGFEGVVVTDSMRMGAIADNYEYSDAVVRTIAAGADLVLTGNVSPDTLFEARDAVVASVEANELPESRIDESVERILRLKERYDLHDRRYVDPLDALETTRREDHETLSRTAYERSYTVIDDAGTLPLTDTTSLLVTGVRGVRDCARHFDATFGDVISYSLAASDPVDEPAPTFEPDSTTAAVERLGSLAEDVDVALVTTFARDTLPHGQRDVIETLARELPVVVVSLGVPNEYGQLPEEVTYVATYAQERLGRPSPLPATACEALVRRLRQPSPELCESPSV